MESYICYLDLELEGFEFDSSDPESSGTTSDASTTSSDTSESANPAFTDPESNASTDPISFHPQEGDVRAVRLSLLRRLPLELADIILDIAMYWPRVISHGTQQEVARASYQPQNDASFVYLVTAPIPPLPHMNDMDTSMYDGDRPAKVHMVRFSLSSHDQGWGGEQGPYQRSYSWFEACIYRFATDDFYLENSEQANASSMMWVTQDELQDGGSVTQVTSPVNGKQTWLIQRNVRASSEVREHTITWMDTDTDETGSAGDEEPDTGRGRGTGFVRSLAGGDRIAIVVRALYPGWENHVFNTQVEVFYSI